MNSKIDTDFINQIYDDMENVKTDNKNNRKINKINSLNETIDILKIEAMNHLKQSMIQIKKDFDDKTIDGDIMVNRIITVGQKFESLDKIIKMKEKKVIKQKTKFVLCVD
jgi:hypothetical protein